MDVTKLKVSDTGWITLLASHRKLVGLEQGGAVVVWVEDGKICIRTVSDAMARLQAKAKSLFAGKGASVDDFLASRQVGAGRENRENDQRDE